MSILIPDGNLSKFSDFFLLVSANNMNVLTKEQRDVKIRKEIFLSSFSLFIQRIVENRRAKIMVKRVQPDTLSFCNKENR